MPRHSGALQGSATISELGAGDACTALVLDGVPLSVCSAMMPAVPFITPAPDDALQVASAVYPGEPYSELSIRAIPYGGRIGDWPPAQRGSASVYRALLEAYRREQGGTPRPGPTAVLFGRPVEGIASAVSLNIRGSDPVPVVLVEWVTEAGDRVWLVRLAREPGASSAAAGAVEESSSIVLSSTHLSVPSTSAASLRAEQAARLPAQSAASAPEGDLPFPAWWDGDCDRNYYYRKTGIYAYPLGGSYRGVKACGPRPWADRAPDVLVYFFPGAWGQYEWQCPELSKRFMYLAYEIPPYPANGNTVVWNCDPAKGCWLEKVANGTIGRAPAPGDVLSYGSSDPYGHTSVVAQSNVDANGNGSIVVIEQNSSATGLRTLVVSNWRVLSSMAVSGWLHNAGNFSVPIAPAALSLEGPDVALIGSAVCFTATVGRVATLQPLTYTWQVTDYPPIVQTAGLSDTLTISWNTPGPKTVSVTTRNRAGAATAAATLTLYPPLRASFSALPRAVQVPASVQFTDSSSGLITSWRWDFGDGVTSTLQHPTHAYSAAGTYTVSLAVSGLGGSAFSGQPYFIRVGTGPLVAFFTASAMTVSEGAPVQFTDLSVGQITAWRWDFGDGTTSALSSPMHVYPVPGVYTVSLSVSGPDGSDTFRHPVPMRVLQRRVWLPLALRILEEGGSQVPRCQNVVLNGGFEEDGAWEFPQTPCTAALTTQFAHEGQRAVRIGLVPPSADTLCWSSARQSVVLPGDVSTATLSAWLYPVSENIGGRDAQYIQLYDEGGTLLSQLWRGLSNAQSWEWRQYDLTSYRGKTLRLHFGVYNDGTGGRTALYVDDVSLEVCR